MFLADAEGGGDADGVALFAVLHESGHVERGAHVRIDGTPQQLKRVAVDGTEADFPALSVKGLVDARVQDDLIETDLAGHAGGQLALALQQDGLNVVQNQLALGGICTERGGVTLGHTHTTTPWLMECPHPVISSYLDSPVSRPHPSTRPHPSFQNTTPTPQ